MLAKLTAMLLMISLPATAMGQMTTIPADDLRSYNPDECFPQMGCICFPQPAVNKIANEIKYADMCSAQLDLANARINQFAREGTPDVEWWQQPTFIVGGLVVSLSVGLWVGALTVK